MFACRWVISFLKRLIVTPLLQTFGWSRSQSVRSVHGRPPSLPPAGGAWRCAPGVADTARCRAAHASGEAGCPPRGTPRSAPTSDRTATEGYDRVALAVLGVL